MTKLNGVNMSFCPNMDTERTIPIGIYHKIIENIAIQILGQGLTNIPLKLNGQKSLWELSPFENYTPCENKNYNLPESSNVAGAKYINKHAIIKYLLQKHSL